MRLKLLLFASVLQITILEGQAQNELWGMTHSGGASHYLGTIFKTQADGSNLEVQHNFTTNFSGARPAATLTEANNGMLYGMTTSGGVKNKGVLFEFNPATNAYTWKMDFVGGSTGAIPLGNLLRAATGNLYGLTSSGGVNNLGVLFEFNPSTGLFTKKFDFTASTGSYPQGSLLLATDGKMYGLAQGGGANNKGILFEYDPATNTFTVKIDFNGANGANPQGNDLVEASNGKLYGMTLGGGANDMGTLFEYDPTTNSLNKKLDFNGTLNGAAPHGSLVQHANGKLYGMTTSGGIGDKGVIFEFDPVSFSYQKKMDFTGPENGQMPRGSLAKGANGKLYGMTFSGNFSDGNGLGILFEYDPLTNTYTTKKSFNDLTGFAPEGSLMLASNGHLYGMLLSGGANDDGTLFEYNTATQTFTKKVDFGFAPNGSNPTGNLTYAPNGKFYGLTGNGGVNGQGVLFEFDPVTRIYTKKFDFDGSDHGELPVGSLSLSPDNKLFGTTYKGGAFNKGTLFEYDYSTGVLKRKISFEGTDTGAFPYGTLTLAGNEKMYGMTYIGGVNQQGVIFEYDPTTGSLSKKYDFVSATGGGPQGNLTAGSNGKLYGVTQSGGLHDAGVIFEFDPSSGTYLRKFDFDGASSGSNPYAGLMEASNNKLYGVTPFGGPDNRGVLFEFDISTDTFTKKINFDLSTYGANPSGVLTESPNGKLYGLTTHGGAAEAGVLFEYDPVSSTISTKQNFDETNGAYPQSGASLVYTKNAQAITFNTLTEKTYGDPIFIITASATSSLPVTLSSLDPAIASIVNNTITIHQAGVVTIRARQRGNHLFYPAPDVLQTLTINKAVLTVTASSQTRTYGANNPEFAFVYAGFVGLDDPAGIDAPPFASSTATPFSNAGNYPITLSGGNDNNYNFSFIPGNLEVTKASLTITAENKTRPYGTANPAFTLSYVGFVGTDNASVLNTIPTSSTSASDLSAVGTYPIVLTGGTDNNYAFTLVNGTLTVTKADQTIQFNSIADRLISASPFTLTATATSGLPIVYNSDSDKITFAGNSATLKNPGRVTIVASQPGNESYEAALSVSQSFCILPAKPTITASTVTGYPTLTSSASNGNQWYYNGNAITGATSNTLDVIFSGSYKVQVKIEDCASEFSDVLPVVITGDISQSRQIAVYPNPSSGNVFVTGLPDRLGTTNLIDVVGQRHSVFWQYENGIYKTDISKFPPGFYVMQIQYGNEILLVKLVRE